jgi:3-hydroxybutyryl-CoA dehydrogenase
MTTTDLNHVGVVGAGVIGRGVVQDLAQTGHLVTVVDLTAQVLSQARKEIANSVRFHHLLARTKERFDQDEVLGRIHFTTDYARLEVVDFVIENAHEDWDVKAKIYPELDKICRAATILAANTSAIPIDRIASVTSRPDRVIGIHFMNPVPLKPAVEVILSADTSPGTLETATRLLSQMNKQAIIVNDSPGFVSNRVLMLTVNEAVSLVQEQVASPANIDDLFRSCFGHAMGPLETADLIGLDTILRSLEVLRDALGSRFQPSALLQDMVGEGKLGRKSGRGFYDYPSLTDHEEGRRDD